MKRRAALVLVLVLPLLVGCKKKPLHLSVSVDPELKGLVTLTVAGQVLPTLATSTTTGTSWKPGEEPADLTVQGSYVTPCGKRTFSVKPSDQVSEGKFERSRYVRVSKTMLTGITDLWLDPALEGALSLGEVPVPTPFPRSMRVVFGDCPRVLKVDGRDVAIPQVEYKTVLVARDERRCFLDGEVLFGPAGGGCRPESSSKLTGQMTYVLSDSRQYLFEGVPMSTKVYGRGKCGNSKYLQVCAR